jgi:hypothetical protein
MLADFFYGSSYFYHYIGGCVGVMSGPIKLCYKIASENGRLKFVVLFSRIFSLYPFRSFL